MVGDGFLLVDKPAGTTSFRVVDQVRRALLQHAPHLQPRHQGRGGHRPPKFKCGHTGTLDPLATGLLVVLTGKGSRLASFITGHDKTYIATVRFGAETVSHDAEGEITREAPAPSTSEAVTAVLEGFRGEIMQVPPLVSALKRDGRPLHARVRAGEDLAEPDPRPARIERLEVLDARWPDPESGACEIDLEVVCAAGTYIRSLARDIGRAAGSAAHVAALRRTAVGAFSVADALTDIFTATGAELAAALRPLANSLPGTPQVPLTSEQDATVRLGGQPTADWFPQPFPPGTDLFRLLGADGSLTAVGRMEEDGPRLAVVVAPPLPTEETDKCD